MTNDFGNVTLSQRPQLPTQPERPLGTKHDRENFLSPFSIIIEYCNRSTFHTKHRPEKYAEYFQATKQAFHEKYPAMDIIGNPEEHFSGRRAWRVQDELRPLQDVSRPRLGAFEVTLICSRSGPRTVFSKLESGCWPNAKALVERAESVFKYGEPLPPVLGYKDSLKFSRRLNSSPLPGANCLKVKRNLPVYEPRFLRSWQPPTTTPPARIPDLRELSTLLYRRGGPSPKRQSNQPDERNTDGTHQDFVLGLEGFTEFAEAYLQQEKSWQSWHSSALDSGLLDQKYVPPLAVDKKLGTTIDEEACRSLEPQAPSTCRPSSHSSRPGSSGRNLVHTIDGMVSDWSGEQRSNTSETLVQGNANPEKAATREQRDSTYEEFEEDESETHQQAALGDSWSEFEDSRVMDSKRDLDLNDEELALGDEVEVLPGVSLNVDGKECYGPLDKGKVSKAPYVFDGVETLEVYWYRTGRTTTIPKDEWPKSFCFLGSTNMKESLGDELEALSEREMREGECTKPPLEELDLSPPRPLSPSSPEGGCGRPPVEVLRPEPPLLSPEVGLPYSEMTFDVPPPPLLLDQDFPERSCEIMPVTSSESLASPSKPSRRPPLPPSTILPPREPSLLNEPEEFFTFLQPEGCTDDDNVAFPSPPFPAPTQVRSEIGRDVYDEAANFDDDLETLTDASTEDDYDSASGFHANPNSAIYDKEAVAKAESSDDESSIVLNDQHMRTSQVGSLEFMGLSNAEDRSSDEDEGIDMVARAIAQGDAESEGSFTSADMVEVRGYDYDYVDDWIPPTGSSRENKAPERSSRAQDDSWAFDKSLEAEDDDEDDMLS